MNPLQSKNSRHTFFTSILDDRYFCPICKDVICDPFQACCGCRFCKNCIEVLFLSDTICPNCSNEFESKSTYADRAFQKELFNLKVKCLNKGCIEIMQLKLLNDHLNSCVFRILACDKCNMEVPGNNMSHHLSDECSEREVKCSFCKHSMKFHELDAVHLNIKNVDNICDKWNGICPLKCSNTTVVNIKQHLKECDYCIISCEYFIYGCSFKGNQINIDEHMSFATKDHMEMLKNQIGLINKYNETNIQNEHILAINQELLNTNQKLKDEVNELHRQIQVISKQMSFFKDTFNQNPALASPLQAESGRINSTRDTAQVRTSSLTAGNVPSPVSNHVDSLMSQFDWRIDNFHHLLAQDASQIIYSDEFYTGTPGYHMRLKLFPRGDGAKNADYVSLYFQLLQGQYDNEMTWPFNRRLSLSLLTSRAGHLDWIVRMRPNDSANMDSYNKPQAKFNLAVGVPKFIEISSLQSSDNIYLHDGHAIIIRFKTKL